MAAEKKRFFHNIGLFRNGGITFILIRTGVKKLCPQGEYKPIKKVPVILNRHLILKAFKIWIVKYPYFKKAILPSQIACLNFNLPFFMQLFPSCLSSVAAVPLRWLLFSPRWNCRTFGYAPRQAGLRMTFALQRKCT